MHFERFYSALWFASIEPDDVFDADNGFDRRQQPLADEARNAGDHHRCG